MQESRSDDMDLLVLAESLFRFFRYFGFLLLIYATLGLLTGYVAYRNLPKIYSTSLLLHSYSLTNTEQINIIENWNELLKAKEYQVLGERLNCAPSVFKKVSKIAAAETQKLYIPNNPNGFTITVWVRDNSILDTLQKGIIYGLENSDYMKAKLGTRRADLIHLIDKVKMELVKLDSTKRNILASVQANNQHASSFIIDLSNLNIQTISLNEKMIGYEEELKFTSAAQVLHKFEKFGKPSSPKLLTCVGVGFLGGLFIGFIVAGFQIIRKKMKTTEKRETGLNAF